MWTVGEWWKGKGRGTESMRAVGRGGEGCGSVGEV